MGASAEPNIIVGSDPANHPNVRRAFDILASDQNKDSRMRYALIAKLRRKRLTAVAYNFLHLL